MIRYWTRGPRSALVLPAVGLSLLLVPMPSAAAVTPETGAGPDARGRVQRQIDWRPCPTETLPTRQCGSVRVPLDYDRPDGRHLRIAVARIPATGSPRQRVGSLLWDAGGPGGVSTDSMSLGTSLSRAVKRRFDFVAFDPRGVGASRPALGECGQPWPVRPAHDPQPSWRAVQRRSAALLAPANRACARRANAFVAHLGTVNVARDLERLRIAVGDDRLTFWGTSYGTRIGYVYALQRPGRIRAMVLDGNIDPSAGYAALAEVGGTAQDRAFAFIERRRPQLAEVIDGTARRLTRSPVPLGDDLLLTRWSWLDAVGGVLPFPQSWAMVGEIATIIPVARGSGADAEAAREVLRGLVRAPNTNEGQVFSVVNCLDYTDRLSDRHQWRAARANDDGPFGGSLTLSYAMGCAGLGGVSPDPVPLVTTREDRARLAGLPVVIANSTHDGSTPMPWARSMWRAFGEPPLIRLRSTQHVIWGAAGSSCVDRPIDRLVLSGRQPTSRVCPFPSP